MTGVGGKGLFKEAAHGALMHPGGKRAQTVAAKIQPDQAN
jgi:hypothetical protein